MRVKCGCSGYIPVVSIVGVLRVRGAVLDGSRLLLHVVAVLGRGVLK